MADRRVDEAGPFCTRARRQLGRIILDLEGNVIAVSQTAIPEQVRHLIGSALELSIRDDVPALNHDQRGTIRSLGGMSSWVHDWITSPE